MSVTSRFSTCTVLFSVRPPHPLNRFLSVSHTTAENLHGASQTQPPHHAVPLVKASISSNLFETSVPWLCFRPSSFPSRSLMVCGWVHRGVLAILAHVQLFKTLTSALLLSFLFLFIIPKMVYTKTDDIAVHVKVCLRMNPHLFLAMT